MKRILKILSVLAAFILMLAYPVKADYNEHVIDTENILSEEQAAELEAMAEEASEKHNVGIYIRVYYDYDLAGFNTIEDYAESIYRQEGLGYGESKDCILLLITTRDRSFDIFSSYGGKAEEAFTAYAREEMAGILVEGYLSENDFSGGFEAYINLCDQFLGYQEAGTPVSPEFDPIREAEEQRKKEEADRASRTAKTAATGILPPLAALLSVLGMRARNKTAKIATEATGYIKGTKMTRVTDRFLYRNRTVTHIQRESSSGGSSFHSSSGSSGGHTSGHF